MKDIDFGVFFNFSNDIYCAPNIHICDIITTIFVKKLMNISKLNQNINKNCSKYKQLCF